VILDISATDANRQTALETVHLVADAIFIPLTVGGGIRTKEDFRAIQSPYAENRTYGGVGGLTREIPSVRPDRLLCFPSRPSRPSR